MNYLAIFLAAVACMVVASIWYGPMFGKQFMRLSGMGKKDSSEMSKMTYVYELISTMVMIAVYYLLVNALGNGTFMGSMEVAFTVWLGFIVTGNVSQVLRSKNQARGLFWIHAIYGLLALITSALIYSAF